MLFGDRIITVVNHWTAGKETVYSCRQLTGCSWYAQFNRAVDTPGQKPTTIHRIRIPTKENGATYADADSWSSLPSEDRKKVWTLGHDTMLVRGTVKVTTDAEFLALRRSGKCTAALSWHANTRGVTPHWYVEGS